MQNRPTEIYLALGSNLGDRLVTLNSAVTVLKTKVDNLKMSKVYETEPWGITDQPSFLNTCVSGTTLLTPDELLKFVKGIERRLGRRKRQKWGPREIDIDILYYADQLVNKPGLNIPHPYLQERSFVLVPLMDIAPDFKHPLLHKNTPTE